MGGIMKSESAYRKEIHRILEANVWPLAIAETAITVLGIVVVFCLVKMTQAVLLAW